MTTHQTNFRVKSIKSALLIGAASLAMIGGGALVLAPSPAFAQKGVVLQPLTGWSVKNIKSADNSSSYCAIARRFRGDLILSVAQNHNDESSVALDFSNEAFDVDQSFSITLDAGVGQVRQFDVYPVSRKAFVVRLGRDDVFFDALSRTGQLRVEVRGRMYNFNLSDIDRGRDELARCLAKNASYAKVSPQSAPSAPSISAEETKAFKELSRRLELLEKENRTLKTELDDVQNDFTAQTGMAAPVPLSILPEREIGAVDIVPPPGNVLNAREHSVKEQQHQRSLNKLLSAKPENTSGMDAQRVQDKVVAKAKLDNSQELSAREREMLYPDAERVKNLRTLEYLREENEKLRQTLQANPNASAELKAMNELADKLSDENLQLTNQLAQMHEAKANFLTQIAKMEEDEAALKLSLEEKEKYQLKMREQIDTLEQKVLSLETDNGRYREAIDTTKANLQTTLEQRDDWKGKYSHLAETSRKRIEELEYGLAGKVKEVKELRETMDGGAELQDKLSNEIERLRQENADLNAKLTAELANVQSEREEVMALTHRIGDMRAENEKLRAEIDAYQAENKRQKEEFLTRLEQENAKLAENLKVQQQFKTNIEKLEGEIVSLRGENNDLRDQYAADLKQENQKLEQNLQERKALQQSIDELKAKIEALIKQNEDMRLGYESKLAEQSDKLANALQEKQALEVNVASLKQNVEALELAAESLKTEHSSDIAGQQNLLQAEKQKLAQEQDRLRAVTAEKDALEMRVTDLSAEIESLKADKAQMVSAHAQEVARYEERLQEARAQNSSQDLALSSMRDAKAGLEDRVSKLGAQITALEAKNQELVGDYGSKLKERNSELSQTLQAKMSLEAELSTLNREIEALRQENQTLETDYKAQLMHESARLSDTKAQKDKLESEIASLKDDIAALQTKNTELQAGFAERLERENERLAQSFKEQRKTEETIAGLEKQLDDLRSESSEYAGKWKASEEKLAAMEIALREKEDALTQEREKLARAQNMQGDAQDNIASLRQEIEALKAQNRDAEASFTEKLAQKNSLIREKDAQITALENDISAMKREIESLAKANENLEADLTLAQKEITQYEALLDEKQGRLQAEKQKLVDNMKAQNAYEREISELQRRISALEDDKTKMAESHMEKVGALEDLVQAGQMNKSEAQDEIARLSEKIVALQSENRRLRDEHEDKLREANMKLSLSQEERSGYETRLANLTREIQALGQTNERLEQSLKETQARLDANKGDLDERTKRLELLVHEKESAISKLENEKREIMAQTDAVRQDMTQKLAMQERELAAKYERQLAQRQQEFASAGNDNDAREMQMQSMLEEQQGKLSDMQREREALMRRLQDQNEMLERVRTQLKQQAAQRPQVREASARSVAPQTAPSPQSVSPSSGDNGRDESENRYVDYFSEAGSAAAEVAENTAETVMDVTERAASSASSSSSVQIAEQGMSEAQRQEEQLRRKLSEQDIAPDRSRVRRAAAPRVEQAMNEVSAQVEPTVVEIDSIDMAEVKPENKPAQTITEAVKATGEQVSTSVETARAQAREMRDEIERTSLQPKQSMASQRMPEIYQPGVDVGGLLSLAGVDTAGNVERVDRFSDTSRVAYQWKSGNNVYGSAQQQPLVSMHEYEALVSKYITDTETRCTGDFAVVPSDSAMNNGVRVDRYEIACVGANVDSSASLVFFAQDNVFTVIAHEAPTDRMNMAMDLRDRVADKING